MRACPIMEMSHRSKVFQNIIDEAEADLRDHSGNPVKITKFCFSRAVHPAVFHDPDEPDENGVADYIVTGQWAKKAYAEAQKYGKANKIASSEG